MDTVWIIIMCVLAAFSFASVGVVIYQRRKLNPALDFGEAIAEAWPEIRNILSEFFSYFIEIAQMDKTDYNKAEDFAVDWIMKKLEESTWLMDYEKAMITRQFVIALVRPRLQQLCEMPIEKVDDPSLPK